MAKIMIEVSFKDHKEEKRKRPVSLKRKFQILISSQFKVVF